MSKNRSHYPANSYHSATGKIRYKITNDYIFKIIFQNTEILSAFLCSLLHLSPTEIHTIQVNNPIKIGDRPDEKSFVLDLEITLNDNTVINIEMQVINPENWPERSLSYLCRTFDRLQKGENYRSAKKTLHIGILDFTLFPEYPEFFATYKLLNIKNQHLYSDKFQLNVLELNSTELATKEDKDYGLDHWAALFKADTWEELKMLAAKNEIFDTAAENLYKSLADLRVLKECEAREEYYRNMQEYKQATQEKQQLLQDNQRLLQDNQKLSQDNQQLNQKVDQLTQTIEQLTQTVSTTQEMLSALLLKFGR